jgi:hypothetical protein
VAIDRFRATLTCLQRQLTALSKIKRLKKKKANKTSWSNARNHYFPHSKENKVIEICLEKR